jgi:Cysteine-rich domain
MYTETQVQGFDHAARKREDEQGGVFVCSVCNLEETFHCRGPIPYFCRTVRVPEDSYVARDPFTPPGQRSFLLLGSDCNVCSNPVCQSCSIFYSKRYCKSCAIEHAEEFPNPIKVKVMQPNFLQH